MGIFKEYYNNHLNETTIKREDDIEIYLKHIKNINKDEFTKWFKSQEGYNDNVDKCSDALTKLSGGKHVDLSYEIRNTPEYKKASKNYDNAFSMLRTFNSLKDKQSKEFSKQYTNIKRDIRYKKI